MLEKIESNSFSEDFGVRCQHYTGHLRGKYVEMVWIHWVKYKNKITGRFDTFTITSGFATTHVVVSVRHPITY